MSWDRFEAETHRGEPMKLKPWKKICHKSTIYYTVTASTSLPDLGCGFEIIFKTSSFLPGTERFINQSLSGEFVIPGHSVHRSFMVTFLFRVWSVFWTKPVSGVLHFFLCSLYRGFIHFGNTFWSTSSDTEWFICHIYTHVSTQNRHYTPYLISGFVLLNMLRVTCDSKTYFQFLKQSRNL